MILSHGNTFNKQIKITNLNFCYLTNTIKFYASIGTFEVYINGVLILNGSNDTTNGNYVKIGNGVLLNTLIEIRIISNVPRPCFIGTIYYDDKVFNVNKINSNHFWFSNNSFTEEVVNNDPPLSVIDIDSNAKWIWEESELVKDVIFSVATNMSAV